MQIKEINGTIYIDNDDGDSLMTVRRNWDGSIGMYLDGTFREARTVEGDENTESFVSVDFFPHRR